MVSKVILAVCLIAVSCLFLAEANPAGGLFSGIYSIFKQFFSCLGYGGRRGGYGNDRSFSRGFAAGALTSTLSLSTLGLYGMGFGFNPFFGGLPLISGVPLAGVPIVPGFGFGR